ncbi:hypothetical protein N7510_005185 [Penicillium lagena]|uniref:uncharacterized protein n=1 Tax=Penicillium lagena TaxID=94218 RepID=UPI002541EC96|nr:uncharacterized protein N7510_005185 [Penicillium lagena]KAJ5611991.1 hypothetical protein N7510_005185 [Penicillium lagena]
MHAAHKNGPHSVVPGGVNHQRRFHSWNHWTKLDSFMQVIPSIHICSLRMRVRRVNQSTYQGGRRRAVGRLNYGDLVAQGTPTVKRPVRVTNISPCLPAHERPQSRHKDRESYAKDYASLSGMRVVIVVSS